MNDSINKSLRKKIGQALGQWHMINPDDKVLVGLSGGKDSLILLHALNEFQRRSPVKFSLAALSVKLNGTNTQPLENYCARKNISYEIITHPIIEIIEYRHEKSPCSFCANMRRGILSSWAAEHGFNKLALGHTLDDAVETFFMNLFQTGRAKSFMPAAHMSRTNVTVIRPLILSTETAIIDEVSRLDLPVVASSCPYAGHTNRQRTREFVAGLRDSVPDLYGKIVHALENLSSNESWSNDYTQKQDS